VEPLHSVPSGVPLLAPPALPHPVQPPPPLAPSNPFDNIDPHHAPRAAAALALPGPASGFAAPSSYTTIPAPSRPPKQPALPIQSGQQSGALRTALPASQATSQGSAARQSSSQQHSLPRQQHALPPQQQQQQQPQPSPLCGGVPAQSPRRQPLTPLLGSNKASQSRVGQAAGAGQHRLPSGQQRLPQPNRMQPAAPKLQLPKDLSAEANLHFPGKPAPPGLLARLCGALYRLLRFLVLTGIFGVLLAGTVALWWRQICSNLEAPESVTCMDLQGELQECRVPDDWLPVSPSDHLDKTTWWQPIASGLRIAGYALWAALQVGLCFVGGLLRALLDPCHCAAFIIEPSIS